MDELVRQTVASGHLRATVQVNEAVAHADICLVCVGTPSNGNGSLDLTYVTRVFSEIGAALAQATTYKVIALRSTVLPGTLSEHLLPLLARASGKRIGVDFGVVVNPEFLREGSAIEDFDCPPFTLIGECDPRAGDCLAALYADLPAPIYRTAPDAASMVKYACNAFHALKVTFANEIGRLCKPRGIDSVQVMDIFSQDTKLNISARYLRPGFAFGGSCLPKDLRALVYAARHDDVQVPMLEAILPSNAHHVQVALDTIHDLGKKQISLVGLSFKAHTDDLRESPMVVLAETLLGKGFKVHIYDNNINLSRLVGGNRAYIEQTIPHIAALMCESLAEAVDVADVIVLAHHVGEDLAPLMRPDQTLIDLSRVFSRQSWEGEAAYDALC
jgi:GDP-mannose 6-dehydrogenase